MRRLNRLKAASRLAICVCISIAATAIAFWAHLEPVTSLLLGWDVFSASLICLSALLFFTTNSKETRHLAQRQDESRSASFVLILAGVCISLVGILVLMNPAEPGMANAHAHYSIAFGGVALAWLLLHTLFTLHYAHLYYTDPNSALLEQTGGLQFPESGQEPDYLDFAYFSFIIGMTFQVSDVSISSRSIRRVVLLHSLLSFVFNTIIVALSISALSNLRH